jgi:transposase
MWYMRPQGSPVELERRRRRAVALGERGESPAVIARILGVARPSVYRWLKLAAAGPEGLAAHPHPGPLSRLTAEQHRALEHLLLQGAPAHGWETDRWTCKRVAEVIRRTFGIAYHPEHVRKILYRRLSWSSQKPERRARERDEAEIEQWQQEEWPRIKKRRPAAGYPGFLR